MAEVALRPMTQEEYERWRPAALEAYAHERARNLDTPVEEQRAVAARQFDQLLADGPQTEGVHLWHVVLETGEVAGTLWVQLGVDRRHAFVYLIEIDAAHRRRGYARRALQLLEEAVRPLGVRHIGLNVFADNAGAQALYRQVGYEVTNMHMQKAI